MATIDFYINTAGFNYDIDVSGSGLGFFGALGYGQSVQVGQYQGTTFVTNGAGTIKGPQAGNIKFLNTGSGIVGTATSGIGLKAIPNYQSTVNIRFTHTSAVKVQNCEMRIFDRSNTNNAASGVTTKVAEIIHPAVLQTTTGSGDEAWITPKGSGTVVNFAASPGPSGIMAGDGVTEISTKADTRHDWFAAMSASPDSIGDKTSFGMHFALEYI
tara:strand:- start:1287 stop:1928 length:642 start_codon:yes stop_codon:yes gene_type:complete